MKVCQSHSEITQNISILVVEEENSISSILKDTPIKHIKKLLLASSGAEGIRLYLQERPDIILVDVSSLDSDGFEMVEEIKRDAHDDVPIVFFSCFGNDSHFRKGLELGINRYIKKPIDLEELEKAIIDLSVLQYNHQQIEEMCLRTYDILDMLASMVILTDGHSINYANKSFLDFVSFESFHDFSCEYTYVSNLDSLIVKIDDYIVKEDLSWFEYLKENATSSPVIFLHDVKENTSTAFLCSFNAFPSLEGNYLITFSDITHLETNRAEFKQEAEQSAQLKLLIAEKADELREQEEVMLQQSKMAAMGEMIGTISHQLQQPITATQLMLDNLTSSYDEGTLTPEEFHKTCAAIMHQSNFMGHTIKDFKTFLAPNKKKHVFNVLEDIEKTMMIMTPAMRANNIEVQLLHDPEISKEILVSGFSNEFKQVILNLLNNGKEAIIEHRIRTKERFRGYVNINLSLTEEDDVQIAISDNGGGVPARLLATIFDSYFTTKEEGTGIGLHISQIIIENRMHGQIRVRNDDAGACFTLTLPHYTAE